MSRYEVHVVLRGLEVGQQTSVGEHTAERVDDLGKGVPGFVVNSRRPALTASGAVTTLLDAQCTVCGLPARTSSDERAVSEGRLSPSILDERTCDPRRHVKVED